MLGTATAEQQTSPHLMKPSARINARILRTAIGRVAHEEGMDFMALEDTYTSVRSALVHLLAHERYPSNIGDMIGDIVKKTRQLLSMPGIERLSMKKNWVEELTSVTAALDLERQRMFGDSTVSPRQVDLFLKVVDASRETHLAESYDPGDVITAELYVFAHLVASNFEAYDKTLNT